MRWVSRTAISPIGAAPSAGRSAYRSRCKRPASVAGWIEGDQTLARPMIEQSAADYAAKEGVTPRNCKDDIYHRLASGR